MIQTKIPQEHEVLFNDYLKRVESLTQVNTIMWVVIEYGSRIEMIEKDIHKTRVSQLLRSGDSVREKVAIEVMKRTLGIWDRRESR